MMKPLVVMSLLWTGGQAVELLGAGEGPGSCAAPPFRGQEIITRRNSVLEILCCRKKAQLAQWMPSDCPLLQ